MSDEEFTVSKRRKDGTKVPVEELKKKAEQDKEKQLPLPKEQAPVKETKPIFPEKTEEKISPPQQMPAI